MKVTVERSKPKVDSIFKVGSLVEVDKEKYVDFEGYIVLVTGKENNGDYFGGVVVQTNVAENKDHHFVGDRSDSYIKSSFIKFTGKLIMEQE